MLTVAYLANQFPSAVEPYVLDEIQELKSRGVRVIAGSARRPLPASNTCCVPEIVLQPLPLLVAFRAMGLSLRRCRALWPLLIRVLFGRNEGVGKRVKALAHTWLGACYAVLLEGRDVDHIHVHHGYFGSWIAMVAAHLLGVPFSMTLHGSDLLRHGTYLDVKLDRCQFCLTVSEYNRRYILEHYPSVGAGKVVVSRLGVDLPQLLELPGRTRRTIAGTLTLLAVGRLHPVKDHAFLLRACARLNELGVQFRCLIAGEGPERHNLESLLAELGIGNRVTLLGHVERASLNALYDRADVVALTSQSEGVPLVLMEAMARGKVVLAPSITGIPELVLASKTGFLYEPGCVDAFVDRLLSIRSATSRLNWIRHAARVHVQHNFNRKKNLESFGDAFLRRIAPQTELIPHENFVLQQI